MIGAAPKMTRRLRLSALFLLLGLAACEQSTGPAPVMQGRAYTSPANGRYAPPSGANVVLPPGARNLSHPSQVTALPGETLYGVARRFDVPIRAVIDANHLEPPYRLTSGQILILPQVKTHLVQPGDTLYVVSRLHGVDMTSLAQANHLTKPYAIRAGTVLVLPSANAAPLIAVRSLPNSPSAGIGGSAIPNPPAAIPAARESDGVSAAPLPPLPVSAQLNPPPPASTEPQPSTPAGPPTPTPSEGTFPAPAPLPTDAAQQTPSQSPPPASVSVSGEQAPNKEAASSYGQNPAQSTTAPTPQQSAELPGPPAEGGKGFLWPVRGAVIARYGMATSGTHNDGINISAPAGTPVVAAESGVVAYAGNELRGYGNLVLIKHVDGYMTAYAHNEKLLVARGDKVRRGQVIARVGATGAVSEPQLHFEIRKGTAALDPSDFLPPLNAASAVE